MAELARYPRLAAAIARLAQYERYEGAFLFGSYASGQLTARSDLDVIVLLADGSPACANVSHPRLDSIRVDISFNPWGEIRRMIEEALRAGKRIPWLYNAPILFDKRGRLAELKERVMREAQPVRRSLEDAAAIQYTCYYNYIKPGECLPDDPASAELIMQMELHELLRLHYSLSGRWWVSDKHILADTAGWDPELHDLLARFLRAREVNEKYTCWKAMIEHVLLPLGGKDFRAMEGTCDCENCQADLDRLQSVVAYEER